ncbi:hypothetical protein [Leucobacter chromiireducens]|uniref:hypothetical protein n=1 Tax=Leucobacter chromiireducens TaxID=283877 RepID=UPI003F7F947A
MSVFHSYADRDYEAGEIFDRGVNDFGEEWVLRIRRAVKEGEPMDVDTTPETLLPFEHYKTL